jgi:hypothetical protein
VIPQLRWVFFFDRCAFGKSALNFSGDSHAQDLHADFGVIAGIVGTREWGEPVFSQLSFFDSGMAVSTERER